MSLTTDTTPPASKPTSIGSRFRPVQLSEKRFDAPRGRRGVTMDTRPGRIMSLLEAHAPAHVRISEAMRKGVTGDEMVALRKAVTTADIADLAPESLEMEAHLTTWQETSPIELTLLKTLPWVPATQIVHQYARITDDGRSNDSGFFSEQSLPPQSTFTADRKSVDIKLQGTRYGVWLLASLTRTLEAGGQAGALAQAAASARKLLLEKKAHQIYAADSSTTISTARPKGLEQLIREGTDGTSGTDPAGVHVIDMEGEPLDVDTLRYYRVKSVERFGGFEQLYCAPGARSDIEASLDASHRLELGRTNPVQALMVGQNVGGIITHGGLVYFQSDNTLTSMYYAPFYAARTDKQTGWPTTTPTVVAAAQTDDSDGDDVASKWDTGYMGAGNVFYVVTEVVDEQEGNGTRYPALVTNYTAVAAGEEVKLTLTPSNGSTKSFRVYRGTDADGALTGAAFIFEVKNDGGGNAVVAYDNNTDRPQCTRAFALNCQSKAQSAMLDPKGGGYTYAQGQMEQFLSPMSENSTSSLALAQLGPQMGMMDLAKILATPSNALLYSAWGICLYNALQNYVFKNVGPRTVR